MSQRNKRKSKSLMMQKPAPFDAVNFCHLQKYELAAQASVSQAKGKRKKERIFYKD